MSNTLDELAKTSVIPLIVYKESNPDDTIEVIVCSAVSGGANYNDKMPRTLELTRYLKNGSVYRRRYVQEVLR